MLQSHMYDKHFGIGTICMRARNDVVGVDYTCTASNTCVLGRSWVSEKGQLYNIGTVCP